MDPMIATKTNPSAVAPNDQEMTLDVVLEFHRRMAAMIEAVQTGIWEKGHHDLLGYATDFGFGQQRGVQTLVLKTKHKSSYMRLHWDTLMGDGSAEELAVQSKIRDAITELS
jgi:hypothetical protein